MHCSSGRRARTRTAQPTKPGRCSSSLQVKQVMAVAASLIERHPTPSAEGDTNGSMEEAIESCESAALRTLTSQHRPPRCSVQTRVASQQGACNCGCSFAAVCGVRRSAFFLQSTIPQRIGGRGRRVDERPLPQLFEHVRGVNVPGARYTSAENEHLEIQNVDHAGEQHAERAPKAAEN